ncbi:MAG: hypothetical protein KatS3mg015_2491 [Fimbriimonadales bacterium]|nr:MAG: hypothetical protein KatS3mg015_2491 [Fimbriimonadales bacterium]
MIVLDTPARFKRGHDPAPKHLYLRGTYDPELPAVAIVGARSCSAYGCEVARSLARDLASRGVAIISGLARGIDAEAHRGALEGGGVTYAVLGCGVDLIYPVRHGELAHRIVAGGGGILSEYGPGVQPAPWRFPHRNRIIAGLSDAVVVVEAREQSGALITADFALEAGVPLFAVPGEITSPFSVGTNRLLADGDANAVLSAADVLRELSIESTVS